MSRPESSTMRGRLTRTVVGLGLVSVALLAAVNFVVVKDLLDRSARDQLATVRDLRRDSVDLAIERLLTRMSALGRDPGIADALTALTAGYDAIDTGITNAEADRLSSVYAEVTDKYDAAGVDHPSLEQLDPGSDAGRYVQYHYLAAPGVGTNDRSTVDDAGDGSLYSEAHAEHHPFLRDIAASFGSPDLLLIDLDSGDVVYSVEKRIDLGTDVVDGPFADSTLGEAWSDLGTAAAGDAVTTDASFYLPVMGAPVVHLATAVRADAQVIGAVVLTLPIAALTDLVTAAGKWELLGLGDTGDAYVVGPDLRLRTVPRAWSDNPDAYLDRYRDVYDDDRTADMMAFVGAPTALQVVDNEAVRSALAGEPFVGAVDNPLGRSTVAAAAALDAGDLRWVVVTEVRSTEARSELVRFVVSILTVLVILVIVLTIVGAMLARMLVRPVRPLVDAAARIASGDDHTEVPDLGRNELGDVGQQLAAIATELREQNAAIEAGEQRITEMLASALPPSLVEAARRGERDLVDVVDRAIVIAVHVRGLPHSSGGEQDRVAELLSGVVRVIERVGAQYRVERLRLAVAEQLYFIDGGTEPERAESAASFAVEVIDGIRSVGIDDAAGLDASAGVASGPVATGMIGTGRVSFGAWGAAVSDAVDLARRAMSGQVLVDDDSAAALPADRTRTDRDGAIELVGGMQTGADRDDQEVHG